MKLIRLDPGAGCSGSSDSTATTMWTNIAPSLTQNLSAYAERMARSWRAPNRVRSTARPVAEILFWLLGPACQPRREDFHFDTAPGWSTFGEQRRVNSGERLSADMSQHLRTNRTRRPRCGWAGEHGSEEVVPTGLRSFLVGFGHGTRTPEASSPSKTNASSHPSDTVGDRTRHHDAFRRRPRPPQRWLWPQ